MEQAAINLYWCLHLWRVLVDGGLTHLVICPGSRSGPLAVAAALTPALVRSTAIDERSAAFLALGWVRGTGTPAAVLTTSGTAVANLLPACAEADRSGLPLVVVSADRPARLKNCGANQTAPQEHFLKSVVRQMVQLPLPHHTTVAPGTAGPGSPVNLLTPLLGDALGAARGLGPHPAAAAGPVHLNQPFEEPLHVTASQMEAVRQQFQQQRPRPQTLQKPEPQAAPGCRRTRPVNGLPPLDWDAPGVIVAGPYRGCNRRAFRGDIARLVRRCGWPVLADPCSGLRGVHDLPLITTYDLLLSNPSRLPCPHQVLRLGPCSPSRHLQRWLEQGDTLQIQVCEGDARNWDPLARVRWRSGSGLADLLTHLGPGQPSPAALALQNRWLQQQREALTWLQQQLQPTATVAEPWLAAAVSHWLDQRHGGPGCALIANSSPIRDWECFAHPERPHRLECFRGVSGIDGTLSLAAGLALSSRDDRPTLLVSGDLALLHDSNGWLWRPRLQAAGRSLLVVLIDNGGGGIFEQLPIRADGIPMEELFVMGQTVDPLALAAAHGVPGQALAEPQLLFTALDRSSLDAQQAGMALLRCCTHARADHHWRQQLQRRWQARPPLAAETGAMDAAPHGFTTIPASPQL